MLARSQGARVISQRRSMWISSAAIVLASALSASRSASAQESGWVLQGEGGLVTALVLDPTAPAIVYATTARGIFKTINGGTSWRTSGEGLEGKSVLSLAIDPAKNSKLFATTDTGGVYRSLDGGEHWSESNTGLAARYVGSIAVDSASTIWAGTEAGRIFKSVNGGDSWTETVPPTAHISVMAIAPDPVKPGTLYVGTNSEGVYKTVDGGATWLHMTKGLKRATVWNILVDKSSPSTVYAGTHEGFYKSVNGGDFWTPGNKGLTSFNILALAVDPLSPSTLYAGTAAGVFQTADAGGSWRSLYPDLYATAIALDPSTPSTLYAGTHLGVMKTQDRGARWSPLRMASPPDELAAKPLVPLPVGHPRPGETSLPKLPVVVRQREPERVAPPPSVKPQDAPAPVPVVARGGEPQKEIQAVAPVVGGDRARASGPEFGSPIGDRTREMLDMMARGPSSAGPRDWVLPSDTRGRERPQLSPWPDRGIRDGSPMGRLDRSLERAARAAEARGSAGRR